MATGRHRSVTDPSGPLIPGERLAPPPELAPDQQVQWEAIVARLPGTWFTAENMPLLKELCRHASYADRLASDIEQRRSSPLNDPKELRALLRAHGYQSERIGNLATKLKLSQGSRYVRSSERAAIASRDVPPGRKPWEDWDNQAERLKS